VKLNYFSFLTLSVLGIVFQSGALAQDMQYNEIPSNAVPCKLSENQIPAGSSKHIIEVAHGQAFVDWTDAWAWIFSASYLYRVNNFAAFGGGTGIQLDWTGIYPEVSLNSIFGNKSDGFAAGIDMRFWFTDIIETPGERIWFTIGGYYKNFFIKAMPTFIFGYPKEWYFETGYSFNIRKR